MAAPLFDVIADFAAGPPNTPGVNRVSLNSVAGTRSQAWSTKRGRDYELNNAEAGTMTLDMFDRAESLNPTNSSSPWNTSGNSLLPYRCVQTGGWWNTAPALNSNTSFETSVSPWTASGGTLSQSLLNAHTGNYSAQIIPDGVSSQGQINSETFAVTANVSYVFAAWLWLTTAVSGAASVSVNWYNSGLGYLSSGTNYVSAGARTWTRLSATYTAPVGAAYGQIVVAVAGTQPASNVWYVDDASAVPPIGSLAGNLLNSGNQAPGQPSLGFTYGYDPSFENWPLKTTPPNGGMSAVTGLPTGALNSNTGFESGIGPWVGLGGTVVQSSTQKHSGSFSAKSTPNGTSSASQMFSETVPVVAGRQYTLSVWMWATNTVTSNAFIAVSWYDVNNNPLTSTFGSATSLTASTWTQLAGTFTAPPNATQGQIVAEIAGTPATSQIWYLDDASIVNYAFPADGTFPVSVATYTGTGGNWVGWTPRVVPGNTYTVSLDVWAPTGLVIRLGWNGSTGVLTTITGNNAYQTISLAFAPIASDFPNAFVYLDTPSASSYPQTVYLANYGLVGLQPGWTQTSGSAMRYTMARAQAGNFALGNVFAANTDTMSLVMPTVPGNQYTVSAYCYAQTTAATMTMKIGASSTATVGVGSWQRLSLTFTASAAVTTVTWGCTGTAPITAYVDAIQLEFGSSASTFSLTGPTWFPRYTGYIERYPQTWKDAGFRGDKPLEAVDALSVLSRTVISQSYQATILADNPNLYIPYNDLSIPQQVQLPQGGAPQTGYSYFGTSGGGSVNFQGDTFLDGTAAVSVVQQNSNPIGYDSLRTTYLGTLGGSLSMNPQGFTIECWVKVTAGTPYFGAGAIQQGENPNTEASGPQYYVGWYTSGGSLTAHYVDPNGSVAFTNNFSSTGITNTHPDGNWHYLVLTFLGSNQYTFQWDYGISTVHTMSGAPSVAVGLTNFFVDATTAYGDPLTQISIANLACYPVALSSARALAHYNRGIGYQGEISGARVARLLAQYWSPRNYVAAPGYIALAPDFNYDPVGSPQSARVMLDVLQEISTTENGFVYANAAGTPVWEDRSTRVAQQTPVAVLGNGSGQLAYEDIQYDYDPTYVYSQVNLSRPANSNYAPQINNTSFANYGQRILSATLQVNNDFDLQQAATFYLSRYANPGGAPGTTAGPRIRKLSLNPGANPALWNFCLTCDLSQRVTVSFKLSTGQTMAYDYYVENIAEKRDPATKTWTMDLQLSPVFAPNSWILGDSTYGVLGTTTIPVY